MVEGRDVYISNLREKFDSGSGGDVLVAATMVWHGVGNSGVAMATSTVWLWPCGYSRKRWKCFFFFGSFIFLVLKGG